MTIEGAWFDGTAAYRDQKAGKAKAHEAYEEPETIRLSPLPCWQHLAAEAYQRRMAEMVASIEQETREHYRHAGTAPTGTSLVLAGDPHEKPWTVKRSPAPAFHAASRKARTLLRGAYLCFVIAYREAARKLRRGEQSVAFPSGSFPPALPFVPE